MLDATLTRNTDGVLSDEQREVLRRLIREQRGPDPWIDGDGCESTQQIALRS